MIYNRTCANPDCQKSFATRLKRKAYCDPDCQRRAAANDKKSIARYNAASKAKRRAAREAERNKLTMSQTNDIARISGMSYGQYQSARRLGLIS